MKIDRALFDVSFERNEVFIDERGEFVVTIRLGFQPSTGSSGRCGAEIDQQWFLLFLRFGECCISVCSPAYLHLHLLLRVVMQFEVPEVYNAEGVC